MKQQLRSTTVAIGAIQAAIAFVVMLAACASQQTGVPAQIYGTPGSPDATMTISGKQLPPPDLKFGGVIKEDALQSKIWWAPRVMASKGAPNVLLIITDDAGFGVPSTFGGDANQWQPNLFRNTTQIYPFEGKPDWNLITGMADDAIDYMTRIHQIDPSKPIFIKYAPGATHAPHHPTQEWVDKIHAMHLFDDGYEKLRERIFENQKRLGVIAKDSKLTPWPKDLLKPWDELSAEAKKLFIRQVEVFAAYAAYNDHEIGRVIQAFEDLGRLDNTLIIYLNGDNGASAEGGPPGTPNEVAFFNGLSELPVYVQMKFYFQNKISKYSHFMLALHFLYDKKRWGKRIAFSDRLLTLR